MNAHRTFPFVPDPIYWIISWIQGSSLRPFLLHLTYHEAEPVDITPGILYICYFSITLYIDIYNISGGLFTAVRITVSGGEQEVAVVELYVVTVSPVGWIE